VEEVALPSGKGVKHGLSGLGAEGAVERITIVPGEDVACEWLSTILVDSL
jgi:hypothetical protein